eukprot:Tamp_08589.p1 GENE.Tamp_08589~~Tamp_08589.p1  ORF type:complete len:220 (-),score=20.82 Tamp_08589:190-849(-)
MVNQKLPGQSPACVCGCSVNRFLLCESSKISRHWGKKRRGKLRYLIRHQVLPIRVPDNTALADLDTLQLELELEAQIDLCQNLRNKLKAHDEAKESEARTTFLAEQDTGQDVETLELCPEKEESGWDGRWAVVREAGTPMSECEEGGGESNDRVDREAELSQMCEEYLGDRAMRFPNARNPRTGGGGKRESSLEREQELLRATPQMGRKAHEVSGVLHL